MAKQIVMSKRKRIAFVAHNNKKEELIKCLKKHRIVLSQHELFGTGTTGSLVEKAVHVPVTKFQSGPFGGDQQIGALIASQQLDMLFFLIDPLDCHPHDVDVLALVRIAQVWGIVCATTTTSIDFILTSPAMKESHARNVISSIPVLRNITKNEEKSVTPLLLKQDVSTVDETSNEKLENTSDVASSGKKPITQLQTQNVSVKKEKIITRFPHLLPKRQYPVIQRTVLKTFN